MVNYQDTTLSISERVEALIAEMTPREKAAQLLGIWAVALLDEQRRFALDEQNNVLQHGVGQVSRVGGNALLPPPQIAALANQIQRYLIEQTRLGIPAMIHEESCAGVLMRGATSFPQSIGQAATWEPQLIEAMTKAIRAEMRAIGAHHALAPVLDVSRDARWGRMEETFGEDPFLVSTLGIAYVRGLQGDDLRSGIAATAKHFVGYAASEGGMNWAPAHIMERELREVYLTPFKAAIKEGKLATIMNAYHELDGVACGASKWLMIDILRREWGFEGLLVSDYFTLAQFVDYHHLTDDKIEAARMGLEVGMDLELPTLNIYGDPLLKGLESGRIPIDLVDACVRRVLNAKFACGIFDQPYVDEGRVAEIFDRPETVALSRTIAQKSLVLLKNEGKLLPLPKTLKKVAVIGPSADSPRLMQGDYHYPSHLEHMFNTNLNPDSPTPLHTREEEKAEFNWAEHMPPTVTVLAGIRQKLAGQAEVIYARGCDVLNKDTSGFEEALEAARSAEVVVVVVGDKSGLAEGCTVGESIDSATLELPGVQHQLIEALHATGKPLVVVLTIGRAYALPWLAEHVPSIMVAWLPAQQGGAAIADALFGDVSPGGKLPVSFPRHVGQMPLFYNHKPSGGRSNWQGQYIEMPTTPLYPFGHGLSYASFSYADLSITPQQTHAQGVVQISLSVTNTGSCAADEVVQLYLSDPIASVTRPVQALKGFVRLTLQPQECRRVTFDLDVRHLAFYDLAMRYQVESGMIGVEVGSSSQDIRLKGSFEIVGPSTEVEQVFSTPVHVE